MGLSLAKTVKWLREVQNVYIKYNLEDSDKFIMGVRYLIQRSMTKYDDNATKFQHYVDG